MQQRPNIFFRLALGTGALFVMTILAITATVFSDPRAPSAQFINNHGGKLIAAEVAASLIFAFWAMALDRHRQLRSPSTSSRSDSADGSGQHDDQKDSDQEPHRP